MNLVTPREPFLQHLQYAASLCPTRSTRPILKDVLISVDGAAVEITATDGEVSVRRRYSAEGVEGEGRAALPAATLLSAVRSMDSDELRIEQKESTHELTGGQAFFKLNGDDPDMFPNIPELDAERGFEVPVGAFVSLANRTMFAAAKDMGRYAFNGVLLEAEPAQVTLVATDGRRLSLARMEHETGFPERAEVIVPIKGLHQLQRAVDDDQQMLRVELRETMVGFRLPQTEILAQLVEGEFPDFRAVLPKADDVPESVSLDRDLFASAIHRAAITAGDEGPSVELSFKPGSLAVLSRHEGLGESRSEVAVEYGGDDVGIRFNPTFLGEYLKTLDDGHVTFRFKDRASAGLFEVEGKSTYVVMPITS